MSELEQFLKALPHGRAHAQNDAIHCHPIKQPDLSTQCRLAYRWIEKLLYWKVYAVSCTLGVYIVDVRICAIEALKMKVQTEIKKWGNSLALRLSGVLAEIPQLKAGTQVSIEISEDRLIVTPVRKHQKRTFTEKDLLQGLNAENAHADALATLLPSET